MSFRLFIIIFGCFLIKDVRAQNEYVPPNPIPPSPNAASLGAFGEIPVNHYSGQPNINIPIYQIKTSQHALDISLSYNSNIRVNQDASWVGLGWSLNAGGVITRSIHGSDDFEKTGAYATGYYESEELPQPSEGDPYHFYINDALNDPGLFDDVEYLQDVAEGRIDSQPDVFFYNFGQYSGNFILDKKANGSGIFLFEQNDLKFEITFTAPNLEYGAWKVTTPDGYTYFFNTVELTENCFTNDIALTELDLVGLGPPNQHAEPAFRRSYKKIVSSWYLDSIAAPNGEKITFTYDHWGRSLSNVNQVQKRYDKRYEGLKAQNPVIVDAYGNIICEHIVEPLFPVNSFNWASRQIIDNVYLSEINYKGGTISFLKDDRKDLERFDGGLDPQKLYRIIVTSTDGASQQYDFFYDYFNTSSQDYTPVCYRLCRLKLHSLRKYGETPYKFNYTDPNGMPSKYTKKVDRWGYYNSGIQPITLQNELVPTNLPEVTAPTSLHPGGKTFEGVNRDPDPTGEDPKKGVIESIEYPTGGSSKFYFEPNEYEFVKTTVDSLWTYLANVVSYGIGNMNGEDVYQDSFSADFETLEVSMHAYSTYGSGLDPNQPIAWVKNIDGSIYRIFKLNDTKDELYLSGDYYLEVAAIEDYHIELSARKFEGVSPVYSDKKAAGGLRIRRMENLDQNGVQLKVKRYIYTKNGLLSGESSGLLMDNPVLHNTKIIDKFYINSCTGGGWNLAHQMDYLVRTSFSMYGLGTNAQVGIVGYGNVYELIGENGEGGKTKYTYYNSAPRVSGYVYGIPLLAKAPLNGKIKIQEVIDNDDNVISQTEYVYYPHAPYTKIAGLMIERHPMNDCLGCWHQEESIPYYYYSSGWHILDSKITKNIFKGQEVKAIEKYHYDNPNNKLLTSKEFSDYNGLNITEYYKYPNDFSSIPPYDDMLNKHMISPLVEKRLERNGVVLETSRINYKDWGNGIYEPESIQLRHKLEDFKTVANFYQYDESGNILSASKKSDSKSSYIWGYDNSYPVVKGINISYAELEGLVDQALITSGYTNGMDDLDDFLYSLDNFGDYFRRESWFEFNIALRDLLDSTEFVETYTYKPLAGRTSATDWNGVTTFYQYDGNKLTTVRDYYYQIIKHYEYHYQSQYIWTE